MSQAPTIPVPSTVRAATLPRGLSLFAAISAVLGLLAIVALDRDLESVGLATRDAEAGAVQVWSAAAPAARVPSSDSSVPGALTALAGRELPTQEPTPTF